MSSESVLRACTYVEKGGVGKTTSAAHLAVSAHVDHGLEVLIIDLAGTQNDVATQFGIADEVVDPDAPISAVFGDNWEFIRDNIDDVVDRMVFQTEEGPDLIPSDDGLGGADNNLANVRKEERYTKLDSFVEEDLADRYDLIIMDLPGKEDNIALNGLFASEHTVAPLKPGEFERRQLEHLKADLADIRTEHPVNPELSLVFATMVDRRAKLDKQFVQDLAEAYPGVAGEPVPATQNVGNEQAAGRTLFALDDDELYSTGCEAREAYRMNTSHLLERIQS
jgi:chromosome partitioning protein